MKQLTVYNMYRSLKYRVKKEAEYFQNYAISSNTMIITYIHI